MDLQTQLRYSSRFYIFGKIAQFVYQVIYLAWLAEEVDEDTKLFNILGSIVLVLILLSYYFLYRIRERLFSENVNYFENLILISLDLAIFIITLSGYSVAVVYLTPHTYDEEKEIHAHDSKDSVGLVESEMNRTSADLHNETFDEHIETTTNMLIDKALTIRNDLVSFMNIEENTSESVITPQYEDHNVIATKSLPKSSEGIGYFILPTLLCFGSQLIIFFALVWNGIVNYRIRTAPAPAPPIEMTELNSEALSNR
ncbi:UNVERIFIED_CONTAM: hypothetical protein RMT77_007553 [Armadillidium vulgare]